MLKLKSACALSEKEAEAVKKLEAECNAFDALNGRLQLNNTLNVYEDMQCLFMLFESGALVGYASVFAPDKNVAEISGFIKPDRRRNGYFTYLLSEVFSVLSQCGFDDILYVVDAKSEAAVNIAKNRNLERERSEYSLRLNKEKFIFSESEICLKKAETEDIDEAAVLIGKAFDETERSGRKMLAESLENSAVATYLAYRGNEAVGTCSVNGEDDSLYVYGVGIMPSLRGQGYGKKMMNALVNLLLKTSDQPIELEADDENPAALALYRSLGFETVDKYDYYKDKIGEFARKGL